MKKIQLLLIACCAGLFASAQTTYQPDGTSAFTGANTYCVGAPITTPLTFTYTTCDDGSGTPTGAPAQVYWYYNTTNSTAIGTATLASGPIPFTTATSATGSVSYTPALSIGGNYYFFCVIEWTGGTTACGGVTGTFTSSGTQLVTISPPPIAPAAPINICFGDNIVLTNGFSGGTWTSSNPGVVAINPASGFASGVSAGGSFITYTLGGCYVTAFMYVNDVPAPITPGGPVNICMGNTRLLASTTPGGTWSSTAPVIASVGSTSGLVSAFTAGTATITYQITSTGCFTTRDVNVLSNPAPIAGSPNVCVAGTATLTDPTVGGTWSSSTPSRATISGTGTLSGISAGTTRITYMMPSSCYALVTVNVNTPPAAITGPNQLCASNSITLADAVAGGSWSSSSTATATVGTSTGIVYGVAVGTANISYTVPGCTAVSKNITVNPLPGTISGVFTTCYGQTTTLGSTALGGRWKSSDTTVARVDTVSGIVSGLSMGTTIITYRVSSGCITTTTVTVYPLAPILGSDSVCIASSTALTNIVGGGTWISSNPANATIDATTGIVTGLVNGITYIGYSLPTGCATTFLMEVIPALPPIGGPLMICSHSSVTLSNGVTGGRWSSFNEYVADVDSVTGFMSGHFPDTTVVFYTKFGCVTSSVVTVNALPEPTIGYNWANNKVFTENTYASYQWYDSTFGAIPGATASSYVLPVKTEKYYVVVTDFLGCSAPTKWYKFTVGLDAISLSKSIRVFPNPSSSVVHIEAPVTLSASITSIDGRVVLQGDTTKDIDISGLANGIYFIGLFDADGQQITVRKLLKQ